MSRRSWSFILGPVVVTKTGFGGVELRFHPSHDMGALFCRACPAWGTDRAARRPCPSRRRIEAVGL